MVESALEDKKIFLVVTEDKAKMQSVSAVIRSHTNKAAIFEASELHEALFKFRNAVPHVIILDLEVSKFSTIQLVTDLLKGEHNQFSVIFTSEIPENELFIDQVITGQVQFLTDYSDKACFGQCLTKALKRLQQEKKSEFILRQLVPGELLFEEGHPGDSIFLVKSGELVAWKLKNGQRVDLGIIGPGEFVGEMAHLNQEPRSATVSASQASELIEIPFGSLDMILFSKPSWSKALFMTLSKRLKITNAKLSA